MLPEFAHLLLILAAIAAAVQAAAGLAPIAAPRLARVALAWQALGVLGATLLLGAAFVQNDFSVAYVVQHGHRDLPLLYQISAIWGGHEGSLLLWALILALWSVAAAWLLGRNAPEIIATNGVEPYPRGHFDAQNYPTRVLGMLGVVSLAMLAFILFTSNPFVRVLPAAAEGQSLNPLLQDPGLALHPPLLYLGYVGTAVPFAMTMATLAFGAGLPSGGGGGSGGAGVFPWIRLMRPFALAALAFLSLGIALGSWWAYYELGWGGWWFWDPVENASFMPWLVLAALVHTLAVREGRRLLPHWTAVLAIGAFILSLLGTFLVRSGVLTSVHAFASDPRRGVFMLGLIAGFVLAAMGLYARHAQRLHDARAPQPMALASRETAITLNNLLLSVACASVLLGTLYPLALDALRLGKISVGPPYFDAVLGPIFVLLLALLAPAVWLRWGQGVDAALRRTLIGLAVAFAVALAASIAGLQWAWGSVKPLVALTLAMAITVAWATLLWAAQRLRAGLTASQWGMVIAHLGVAVFACGVAVVSGYGVERDVRLTPAQLPHTLAGRSANPPTDQPADRTDTAAPSQHSVGGCLLTFDRMEPRRGANFMALAGHFTLACPGQTPRALVAEKRNYTGSSMPMTESAIAWGLLQDRYVALGEPLEGTPYGAWSVRVQYKPLMRWVWLGVLLMALGAALAGASRRYAPARQRHTARQTVATQPIQPHAQEACHAD